MSATGGAAPGTPWGLLRAAATGADAGRPLLTSYDETTGERVELSPVTVENWVAKTAGLLRDGLEVEPGATVALLLPAHWQALVWAASAWTAGCQVLLGDRSAPGVVPDVAVGGPGRLEAAVASGAEHVLALSLRPMALPVAGPLPPGVMDYALEVPGFPDRWVPDGPDLPGAPAVRDGDRTLSGAELLELARRRAADVGAGPAARRLVPVGALDLTALVDLLVLPLVTGGSVVMVRGGDEERRARIAVDERVSLPR